MILSGSSIMLTSVRWWLQRWPGLLELVYTAQRWSGPPVQLHCLTSLQLFQKLQDKEREIKIVLTYMLLQQTQITQLTRAISPIFVYDTISNK
jgi:hypothetical protein